LADQHLIELSDLKSLERLRVQSDPSTISSAGIEAITELTNLKDLGLRKINIADRDMLLVKRLGKLESLDISNTSVGDSGVQYIVELPNLRRLYLDRTRVSQAGAARVMATAHIIDASWRGTGIQPETYTRSADRSVDAP
jgi:hypothetical protein